MARGKSKSKQRRPVKPNNSALSEEKWAKMVPYGSFVITDKDDGTEHKFTKDNITMILPHDRDPEDSEIELWEYWVARIKDVRAEIDEEGTNTVWTKVQWFYNGKDVADVVKSFNADTVTEFERIYSDHFDFVESQSFEAVIPVTKFNENDVEPLFISREEFYRRYTFEYKVRSLKPKPGPTTGCICQLPYSPDDPLPGSLMHFCPRPSCRRAYHQSCLLAGKHKESSSTSNSTASSSVPLRSARKHAAPVKRTRSEATPATVLSPSSNRALRLLACSPDTDDNVDLESLIALTVVQVTVNNAEPPQKKRRGRPAKTAAEPAAFNEVHVEAVRSLVDALAALPPVLLQIAQQPMVRGRAFEQGGVSGNIGFVARARRLVYELLKGSSLPDNWEDQVFGKHDEVQLSADNAIVKLQGKSKALPHVVCPNCKSAI